MPTCGVGSIVGLVLGIISLSKISKSRGQLGGHGMALAGTIISGISLVLVPIIAILAAMLLTALARAKARAQTFACESNVKQLCLGVIMYAGDNNEQLPPANTWCDAISKYLGGSEKPFKCFAGDQSQRSHYAFNARLQGVRLGRIQSPNLTVLIFETDGGWNLSGGPELLLNKPRHISSVVVGFADGHVEAVPLSRLGQLRWDPGIARGGGG